jgi:predicted transcriptional regulator
MVTNTESGPRDRLRLAAKIVAAYVVRNQIPGHQIAEALVRVSASLSGLSNSTAEPPPETERRRPAVPVSRSIQHEYLICLEDGKQLKIMKRYLLARYNMTPDDYRRKWRLPPDYPMVAPAYAAHRSTVAKQAGLGRKVRRR